MARRLPFFGIVLFWAVMNGLLWQAEYGGKRELGSRVPVAVVWQKILSAPDDSAMTIFHRGVKRGYCQWLANIGSGDIVGKTNLENETLEGRVKKLTGYSVDLQGNLALEEKEPARFRFDLHAEFGTNHVWKTFLVRSILRPTVWEMKASAASETVVLVTEEKGERWQRVFTFEELRHPERLLDEFGVPWMGGWFGSLSSSNAWTGVSAGVSWQARQDRLKFGHAQMKVYRVAGWLPGGLSVIAYVSTVGELLRVELPGDWLLLNEALAAFKEREKP